jgi:hypothetical protein
MNAPHYLCSELVTLRIKSTASIVNLEEIWREGAILESEDAVEDGVAVGMQCGNVLFAGRVMQVERHELGWRIEVEFSPETHWSQERFQPQHMLDIGRAGGV